MSAEFKKDVAELGLSIAATWIVIFGVAVIIITPVLAVLGICLLLIRSVI